MVLASLGVSARAQVAPAANASVAPDGAETDQPDIVVTGSRLRSRGNETSSPVTVTDAEKFELSGAQTVEELLVQTPQFVGNSFNASGNGANQGVAALNLRGLGERRSLTLVNGRRFTVTGINSLTDLNTIPNALVKRVEVVTGGSSAVYGSDALAGVVNFVLRDDFSGAEVNFDNRLDERTSTPTRSIDLTLGGNFADKRGNAVVSLDYYKRDSIVRGQVPFSAVGYNDGCVTAASYDQTGGRGVPLAVPAGQTCTQAGGRAGLVTGFSSVIPGGRFTGLPLFGSSGSTPGLNTALLAAGLRNLTSFGFTFDPNSNAARAASDPGDRYNNSPLNVFQSPLERRMINAFAHFKVSEAVDLYTEGHYSNYTTDVQIAPLALSGNILVNVGNPYVSVADREVLRQLDLAERGTTTVGAGNRSYTTTPGDGLAVLGSNRRIVEGGESRATSERNTYRVLTGARGRIIGDFDYDLYYSYARTSLRESQFGNVSRSAFQAAILSQNGAAPALNPFGPNLDPGALARITTRSDNYTTTTQQVVAGNLTGSLFKLPAGPVDANIGFEWRKNAITLQPDAFGLTGDVASANGFPIAIAGNATVREGYGEIRVPILADVPLIRRLELNGAARYSDYSTPGVGGVWTYSIGGQYQPVRDLTVRAQLQRAIRAPGVDELFAPQNPGTPGANDPCSSRASSTQQTADVRALCIATGVPASNVFASIVQPNAQVGTLTGGNPNLAPEKARTLTLGASFTPDFLRNFSLSLDAYRIRLDGAISNLGGTIQNTFDLCYLVLKDASSQACRAIVRDPSTGELTATINNDPYFVQQFLANTGGIRTSGIDISTSYRFDAPWLSESGRLSLISDVGYVDEYTLVPVQELPAIRNECVGGYGATCGAPIPRWKALSRVVFNDDLFTFSISHRYTGPVVRDNYLLPQRNGMTPPAKTDVTAQRIKAYNYFDLSMIVSLPERFRISAGVTNVFDKAPPLLGSGASTWGLNTAPGVYEIYGRSFFIGLNKKF
ncbi:TonB-dependent receptor domain-containing protein [Sphingomonas sp. CFBP 8760]|uniref:TonB-dependent receptor domain-containing protein n=1 Tax=Sphingomonas sp. CFBP 8760 TaxID=2775282 RepID=UPI00177B8ED7|nr:TonB-dependent receptor [Sphingomonas sp. CFBP 8760]MBD8548933.1 TonB-dependent receptor [Sphingomonas sp. CFBP 8760]